VGDATKRADLAPHVKRLVAAGCRVTVADIRGFGETAAAKHVFYGIKSPDEELAQLGCLVGVPLVGRRAEDIIAAAKHSGRPVRLIALGRAAIPAAHAYAAARTIANSPLFKAACFGGDPNWGRVICAVGNSGAKCAELRTRIFFDDVCVYDRGRIASAAANARLAAVMKQRAFEVRVDLGMGRFSDAVYTSDLSHGYVSINADYTT